MLKQFRDIFWIRQLVRRIGFDVPVDFDIEDVIVTTSYYIPSSQKWDSVSLRVSREEEMVYYLVTPPITTTNRCTESKIVKKDFSVLITEEEFEKSLAASKRRAVEKYPTYKEYRNGEYVDVCRETDEPCKTKYKEKMNANEA